MSEHWATIQKQVRVGQTKIRDVFQSIHTTDTRLDDKCIDELLGLSVYKYGIEPRDIEQEERLKQKYGNERFLYVGTPYRYIRHAIHGLNPQPTDVVYDLGSGYGRFLLYGALTTDAQYRGIEIISDRVAAARKVKDRLGIRNVEFSAGNVLDFDFSDGTMFYLYNPFTQKTHMVVSDRLYTLAQQKKFILFF